MTKVLLVCAIITTTLLIASRGAANDDAMSAPPIHDEAIPSAAPLLLIDPEKAAVTDCNPDGYIGHQILRAGEKRTSDDQVDPHEIRQPLRILFADSSRTMDFSPKRLNLMVDRETYTITDARCG